jgi:hypothetical protein
MLSAAHLLTRLDLAVDVPLEPAVLAGKTRLQHLLIQNCMVGADGDAAALVELLSPRLQRLQQLQQLTRLDLTTTLGSVRHTAALLGPLSGLSRLQKLQWEDSDCTKEGLGALCQLTGLKSLTAVIPSTLQDERLMLQLTKLKQLTTLNDMSKEVS